MSNLPTRLTAEELAEMRRVNACYMSRPDPPDLVRVDAALLAHISTLEAELEAAQAQVTELQFKLEAATDELELRTSELQAELKEAREQRDAYLNGLGSIRDCTSDMWACSMAGSIAKGISFGDALKAAHKYDQDGEQSADGIRTDAINEWHKQLVTAVQAEFDTCGKCGEAQPRLIELIQSFNPAPDKGE